MVILQSSLSWRKAAGLWSGNQMLKPLLQFSTVSVRNTCLRVSFSEPQTVSFHRALLASTLLSSSYMRRTYGKCCCVSGAGRHRSLDPSVQSWSISKLSSEVWCVRTGWWICIAVWFGLVGFSPSSCSTSLRALSAGPNQHCGSAHQLSESRDLMGAFMLLHVVQTVSRKTIGTCSQCVCLSLMGKRVALPLG